MRRLRPALGRRHRRRPRPPSTQAAGRARRSRPAREGRAAASPQAPHRGRRARRRPHPRRPPPAPPRARRLDDQGGRAGLLRRPFGDRQRPPRPPPRRASPIRAFYTRRRTPHRLRPRDAARSRPPAMIRVESALLASALPESHDDDAWRHNDPPPIPPMTVEQALQLICLHEKSVRQSWERPHRRKRRGEPWETYSQRLAAMWTAEKAREAEEEALRSAARAAPAGDWDDEDADPPAAARARSGDRLEQGRSGQGAAQPQAGFVRRLAPRRLEEARAKPHLSSARAGPAPGACAFSRKSTCPHSPIGRATPLPVSTATAMMTVVPKRPIILGRAAGRGSLCRRGHWRLRLI